MTRHAFAVLALLAATAPAHAQRRARGERLEPPPETRAAPLYPPRVATEPVTFVWPPEGNAFSGEGTFLLGSVSAATAPFRINGTSVSVHRDGGFLAYLPVSPGTFTFRAELDLAGGTAVAERVVLVGAMAAPLGESPVLDEASLTPRADLELRPGDWLVLRARGTPGKAVRARHGRGEWLDLREVAPGVYERSLAVGAADEWPPESVTYELKDGWSKAKGVSPGRASAASRQVWWASVRPNANGFIAVKTNPGNGFLAYPPPGVRMAVTGRDGGMLRVQLHAGLTGWVDAKDVELSSGAAAPRLTSDTVSLTALSSTTVVRVSLTGRAAFAGTVDDDLGGMTLRLFGVSGHTNWVIYDSKEDFVDEVRWTQEATDVLALRVLLKPGRTLWGWNAAYDGAGSSLRLELRRPPKTDRSNPLAGARVMIDPGHNPSETVGRRGPLGTREMDANYALALAVEERLRRDGAVPLRTRQTPLDEVGLAERSRMAVERGADAFVSLHNNAVPDGTNPFSKPRGYSVFYYHPQSLALARNLLKGFQVRVPLADEGLQWGNLSVARLTAMPAVLIECAHFIFPEQEALLNDPKFRAKVADAVVDGLRETFREAGRRPR
ncbi:MAG: N-acetylmuramoyl-L-alanine amidase [Elusimicrobiota bacterium]|nr:N-acetylmuramoyl-L-alanine amidase [Elusimicrobiota bacterium]